MRSIGLIVSVLLAVLCFSQKEHLQPAKDFTKYAGALKDYYENVFSLLYEGFNNKPIIRYTSMPSSSSEYAFSLEEKNGKFIIISNVLSENFWYAKPRSKVKLITNELEISKELFDKVLRLFELLAEQTVNPENDIFGFDGINYYFEAMNTNGEIQIGETWSPGEGSYLRKLVNACNDLHSLGSGNAVSHVEIMKDIEVLIYYFEK